MKNSTKVTVGCVVIGIILIICCLISVVLLIAVASSENYEIPAYTESSMQEGNANEKIVVLDLEGVIMDYEDGVHETSLTQYLLQSLENIKNDDYVKAVILRHNTPGGVVYDTAVIAEKIKEIQAQDKLVVTVIEEMSASGGYWLAASSDYIIIHHTSITGSIGVLAQFTDYDELLNKVGVKVVTITNTEGKNKFMDKVGEEGSDHNKIFKTLLDDSYQDFLKVVTDGRHLTREEVLPYADGRVLNARQALDAKLVDQLGDYDDAVEYIKTQKKLENPTIVNYLWQKAFAWDSITGKLNNMVSKVSPLESTGLKVYAMPEYMVSD